MLIFLPTVKKQIMKKVLVLFFILITGFSYADSPLTSTDFSDVYSEEKMIIHIKKKGLDKKAMKYLLSAKGNPVIKVAMINAIGFGQVDLIDQFETYLLKKRKGLKTEVFDYLRIATNGEPEPNAQTDLLTADDLTCWAYLQALGEYNKPELAGTAAYLGYIRDTGSMAHKTVLGLIACQIAFDYSWCNVYKIGKEVFEDTQYEHNKLSAEAVGIIMDYLGLYKDSCE